MARPQAPWFRASKGTWYARVNGRQTSLGVRGEGNHKAALEAWHRLMAEGGPKPKPKPEVTVKEVLDAFLADCEGRVKPKTLADYKGLLSSFAAAHGQGTASALTPTTAEAFSRKPSWGATTRHDFLGLLATAFRWAERARLLERTPLVGLRRPPKASRGAKALVTPEQHQALLAEAPPAFRTVLELLYLTGARPGEIASITAADLDLEAACAVLEQHKTAHKGKRRVVYLCPEALAVLKPLCERYPSGPLLRNGVGKAWTGNTLVRAMSRCCERAGVKAILYGYRHTFATDALANGVPDAHVAELMGHAGTAMLHKHYAHLSARGQVLRTALASVRRGA